jgi:hypothetical protein
MNLGLGHVLGLGPLFLLATNPQVLLMLLLWWLQMRSLDHISCSADDNMTRHLILNVKPSSVQNVYRLRPRRPSLVLQTSHLKLLL